MNAPANLNTPHAFRGKIALAVITYKYEVDYRVRDSVETACFGLAARNWLVVPTTKKANADLEHGRNSLAAEVAMSQENFDKAIFIDGDVSCDPGTIERLAEHPVDLVLGSYRLRNETGRYALRKLPGPMECINPITGKPHPNGIAKIAAGPAGMMCVSRRCIEQMIRHHDNQWYGAPDVTGNKAWPLFEFDIIEHERISEDMNFCRKWRAIGGDVWLDPHLMLHHHGDKTYSGRIADHLKELDAVIDGERLIKVPGAASISMADLIA